MALTHGNAARNNMADGVDDAVNAGAGTATFVLLDGASTIASFNLQSPAFGNAGAVTTGRITLSGTTLTATATATGTVDSFEIRSKNGTAQLLGTVSTGTGNDLTIDNTNINNGQTVKITSFEWNAPS